MKTTKMTNDHLNMGDIVTVTGLKDASLKHYIGCSAIVRSQKNEYGEFYIEIDNRIISLPKNLLKKTGNIYDNKKGDNNAKA